MVWVVSRMLLSVSDNGDVLLYLTQYHTHLALLHIT